MKMVVFLYWSTGGQQLHLFKPLLLHFKLL